MHHIRREGMVKDISLWSQMRSFTIKPNIKVRNLSFQDFRVLAVLECILHHFGVIQHSSPLKHGMRFYFIAHSHVNIKHCLLCVSFIILIFHVGAMVTTDLKSIQCKLRYLIINN